MDLKQTIKQLELLQAAESAQQQFRAGDAAEEAAHLARAFAALEEKRGAHAGQQEIDKAYKDLSRMLAKKMIDSQSVQQYRTLYLNNVVAELIKQLQEIKHLEIEDAIDLLQLFENGSFGNGPTSLVFLLAARLLAKDIPDIAYSYTIKPFERNPHLAAQFGEKYQSYVYRPVKEIYYEACPVCGSEDAEPYYNAQIFLAPGFSDVFAPAKLWCKCNHCHNLFVYNLPEEIYNAQTTFTLQAEINEIGQVVRMPQQQLTIYCDIINKIKQYNSGRRYLEVGIGKGEFIAVAREMGMAVDAVELSANACKNVELLLGVPIIQADFLDYQSDEPYDAISMGDVIEHVKAPTAAIRKANALLKAGGILWISTPNYDSAFSRLLKFSDPMWKEPGHRVYFCRESFERLLEQEGFEILAYEVSRRYNGSMEILAQKVR